MASFFYRVLQKEKESLTLAKKLKKAPSFQEICEAILLSEAQWNLSYYVYLGSNFIALPVGTATVE